MIVLDTTVIDFINKYIYVAYIIAALIILYLLIRALIMVLDCVKRLSNNATKLTNNISTLTEQTKQVTKFVEGAGDVFGNTSKTLFVLGVISQFRDAKKYTSKPVKKIIVETAIKNAPKYIEIMK